MKHEDRRSTDNNRYRKPKDPTGYQKVRQKIRSTINKKQNAVDTQTFNVVEKHQTKSPKRITNTKETRNKETPKKKGRSEEWNDNRDIIKRISLKYVKSKPNVS